jgi:hypothetical protein
MNPTSTLLSLAEISVTLLGFAAIASVFHSRGAQDWLPDARFWGMVSMGVGTLAFALLPLPFLAAEVALGITWRLCSVALAAAIGAIFAWGFFTLRRSLTSGAAVHRPTFSFLMVSFATVAGLNLANAAGLLHRPSFWPYLVGVLWFQVVTGYVFVRLLFIWLPRSGGTRGR